MTSMNSSDGDTSDYQSVVLAEPYTPDTNEISPTNMNMSVNQD